MLYDSYGFLLAKAEEEMESRFIEKLLPLQLNARQFGVLEYLGEHPNSSQKQVGEALKIDRTTMVSHVDHLEDVQYVRRVRNPKDRRAFVLTITDKGSEQLKIGRIHLENTELDVLSSLSDHEREVLMSILLKVWVSIQKVENDGSY